jgi:hypothetical protein
MDRRKEQLIVDLIKNRPDMNYMQIAFFTGTNISAVEKTARVNNCQRKRGRRPAHTRPR